MAKCSLIDNSYQITHENSLVSLVCKQGTEHGFLLIEHYHEGAVHYYRSDLFIDGDKPSKTIAQHFSLSPIVSSTPVQTRNMIVSGKALIVLDEKDEDYFKDLRDNLDYYSWPISHTKGTQLLASIREDRNRDITYVLGGNGSSWSSVVSECGNYHSCISWAKKKLQVIGIDAGWQWKDMAIQVPSEAVLGAGKPSTCLVL